MTAFKSLRRRSNKMRSRAIFAGILFLLGTIGLAVVAFLPLMVDVSVQWYGALTVANFWQPFADLFGNFEAFLAQPTEMVIAVFCALLFALMILFTVINALRSISKLDRLCMRGSRRVGFNQNKIAVDKMANIFACSYSLVAVHTLVILMLNPSENATFSLLFMIASIVYLSIHIIAGPIVGSISSFTVRDFVAEKPRTHGGFGPFLRNLLQFAAIGGVVFFALQLKELPINLFPELVGALCNMTATLEAFASGDLSVIFHYVVLLIWGIGFLAFLGFFRHAINFTEFNAYGEKAKGRKSARVASFTLFLSIFLLWAHPIILHVCQEGVFPEWNSILDYSFGKLELLYAAAVMLGMFIIECILAKCPKMKKKYRGTNGEVALVYDMPDADGETMAKSATNAPVMMTPSCCGKEPVMVMMCPNGQPVMMVPTPTMQPVAQPVAPVQYVQAAPAQPVQYVQAAPAAPAQPVQYAQPAPVAPVQRVQAAPVAPAQPVQRVQAAPVAPVQSLQKSQYVQPVQGTVPAYTAADINAIKDKWVSRGLAARQNQNK